MNLPDANILVEEVLSILHTSILAHKNVVPQQKTLDTLCQLVDNHIKRFGIQQEGLSLLGAIATTFNHVFHDRSEKYWHHIIAALEQYNNIPTFKAALACIGDFARMSESHFFNKASFLMKKLLEEIKRNFDR